MIEYKQTPPLKSVMIHASAVEYQGKALIFLGPSGTGKSTVSQLLAGTIENVRVLADDKICLDALADGGWAVSDAWPRLLQQAPEAQIDPAFQYVPLGSVLRLHQASCPRLESVSMLETCFYLVEAFAEVGIRQAEDIGEKKVCFANLAAVARTVPGYEFYFDCSVRSANALQLVVSFV